MTVLKTFACVDCGTQGTQPAGRGRPRRRCEPCRDSYVRLGDKRPLKTCPTCGLKIARGTNTTYCSDLCRISAKTAKACEHCGHEFAPDRSASRFCSIECSAESKKGIKQTWVKLVEREVACMLCASAVITSGTVVMCPKCRITRRNERWNNKNRKRRAVLRNVPSEPYTLREIALRDEFVCGLCLTAVDITIPCPEPMSPSIDHIIPLVAGGDDTRSNVQLAHRICNSTKGGRVLEPV